MAASSSFGGGSLHPASSAIEELQEELAVEQTILNSLDGVGPHEDVRRQIAESKEKIEKLKRRLAEARGSTPGSKRHSNPASTMNNWGSYSTLGSNQHLSPFAGASSSSSASSSNALRKRQYPSQLVDDDASSHRTKSYRTTPSPMQTTNATPAATDDFFLHDDAFIDLTGDDDDIQDLLNSQKAAFAQLEQTRADARLAQQLQEARPSPPENSQTASAAASSSAPSAFDRLLGRPAHGGGQSSSQSSQDNNMAGTSSSHIHRSTMPGSFDEDENDDSDFMEGLAAIQSSGRNADPFSSGPSPDTFGQWPTSSAAPLAPASGYAPNGPVSPPALPRSFYGFPPGVTSSMIASEMLQLQSGSYSMLQRNPWLPEALSHASYDNVYNRPPSTVGSTLSNIIGQTNGINWASGLDALGNPLSDRLQSFYDDLQDDPRKTQEEIKDLLANIRPDEEIPEEDRIGTPEALRYPLYPHQQLALQWMMSSETGKNKGGILADDMGLGKTISTLALIVNRPSSDRVKTNLIVGPVALIKQWETEIHKKVKSQHKLSVLLLHGQKGVSYEDIRRYDVVLTSYGKLGSQAKRYELWVEQHPGADPGRDAKLAKDCPLVHPKTKFYRVILDEAQCIKNMNTLQAKGACKVQAVHRWCLTGTPMMNGVQELYSLIRFLKIAPYHNQREFSKMFGSLTVKSGRNRITGEASRTKAMKALRALLKAIMLRRMKTSKLDGKPLLELPPKTEEISYAVFSEDEKTFYDTLESKSQVTFNKYLRAGTVGKNYSNILVLLLRLRQACCHPHLNLDVEEAGNSEVTEQDMISMAGSLEQDVVKRLQTAVGEGFGCPICLDATIDPTIVLPCGHSTCSECFTTLVAGTAQQNLQAGGEGNSGLRCPECRGPIDAKKVINLTAFRTVHMPETLEKTDKKDIRVESEASGSESDDDSSDSDSDGEDDEDEVDDNGNLKGFIADDDEDMDAVKENEDDDDLDVVTPKASRRSAKKSRKGKSKSKGKSKEKKEEVKPHMLKELRLQARRNKAEYKRYMKYLHKNWLPSAKVDTCCNILRDIQESGDKTIVFSQFTFLLDLLEIPIKHDLKIKYCRYDGGMSRQQRDAAAQDFQDVNSPTKVMLVSLKAGNAGLNLTAANHVVIMDPFWNPYIEAQAVDRAYRIGQRKSVQVHRLLVQETVEDRIIELQEQKRQFVDAALDEGESKQLGRLSMKDLQYLFNGRD